MLNAPPRIAAAARREASFIIRRCKHPEGSEARRQHLATVAHHLAPEAGVMVIPADSIEGIGAVEEGLVAVPFDELSEEAQGRIAEHLETTLEELAGSAIGVDALLGLVEASFAEEADVEGLSEPEPPAA